MTKQMKEELGAPKPPVSFTIKQIKDAGIMSERSAWREIANGRLEAFKAGGRVRVTEAALNRYIAENTRRVTMFDPRAVAADMIAAR